MPFPAAIRSISVVLDEIRSAISANAWTRPPPRYGPVLGPGTGHTKTSGAGTPRNLLADFRDALESSRGGVTFHYQAQVRLHTREIESV